MSIKTNHTNKRAMLAVKSLAATLTLAACASASAQTAGTMAVSVGYNYISPQGHTDAFSAPSLPNSTNTVGSDGQPIVAFTYMITDHVSTQFSLGVPYTQKVFGAGALQGVGKLGTFEQVPPTLFLQYSFLDPSSAFRPYVGVGATYAIFSDEQGSGTLTGISNPGGAPTTFTIDNKWAATSEIGLIYAFNSKLYSDIRVAKSWLSTTVHLSTGESATAPMNPIAASLSIGYRF